MLDMAAEQELLRKVEMSRPADAGPIPREPRGYHFLLSEHLRQDPVTGHWILAANSQIDLGASFPAWGLSICRKNAILDDLDSQGLDSLAVKGLYESLQSAAYSDYRAFQQWCPAHRSEAFTPAKLNGIIGAIDNARIVAALQRMFEFDERDNGRHSVSTGGTLACSLCDVTTKLGFTLTALSKRLAELVQPPQPVPPLPAAALFPPRVSRRNGL